MNECDRIKDSLSAYTDGELGEAESGRVKEHLAACAACSAEVAVLGESWSLFKQSYPPQPLPRALLENPYAAPAVSLRLLAALAAASVLFALASSRFWRAPAPASVSMTVPIGIRPHEKKAVLAQDQDDEFPGPSNLAAAPRYSDGASHLAAAPKPGALDLEPDVEAVLRSKPKGLAVPPRLAGGDGSGLRFAPYLEPGSHGARKVLEEIIARRAATPPEIRRIQEEI